MFKSLIARFASLRVEIRIQAETNIARKCIPTMKITNKMNSFIHLVVCLTTGSKPLPKRALHIVRFRAYSFIWEYPLLSLRSCSSFLRLLPRLPVTSIPPFIFPSATRCRRQFRRNIYIYIYIIYQISATCFGAYCTIPKENPCHLLKTICLF